MLKLIYKYSLVAVLCSFLVVGFIRTAIASPAEPNIEQLAEKLVSDIRADGLKKACQSFSAIESEFRDRAMRIMVLNYEGVMICNGWGGSLGKNISEMRGIHGKKFIREQIGAALDGGDQWLDYRGSTQKRDEAIQRSGYVARINDEMFLSLNLHKLLPSKISESKLAKLAVSAVDHFKRVGREEACADFASEQHVYIGDGYHIEVYDGTGTAICHAIRPNLNGMTAKAIQKQTKETYVQEYLKAVKSGGDASLKFNQLPVGRDLMIEQKAFVKVADQKTLVIASSHETRAVWPMSREAVNLAHRAASHIKEVGTEKACAEFTKRSKVFSVGYLHPMVFDLEGVRICDPLNPRFNGRNISRLADIDGKRFVTEYIRTARSGGLKWVEQRRYSQILDMKQTLRTYVVNATQSAFVVVEMHSVPTLTPRDEVAILLARKAKTTVSQFGVETACKKFADESSEFRDTDKHIELYKNNGTQICNPDKPQFNGRGLITLDDIMQRPFIRHFANASSAGGQMWVNFHWMSSNRDKIAEKKGYVLPLDNESFVVVPILKDERSVWGLHSYWRSNP
ncbi:cache domain-containing protein [Cohaesibacter gelatinilyticus]|uniref:Cache domain-containing protein n=1 Tax=Cohaesibacter gelatinilyticus TaxID=372072 RepID=A0A285PE63_9HYPH|nr:cache domain-containing protein [Cohaesibacter gelatinilyticus]SNZ19477.1 Cache domain-containing protein [Cohaesibacter gelatinilyticus]